MFSAYHRGGTLNRDCSNANSLLPNLLNRLVVNARLVVPEPFYQGFKGEFTSRLNGIGYDDGASIRFVDDWNVYHRNVGEVHCGTNVKRDPSRSDWWTQDID